MGLASRTEPSTSLCVLMTVDKILDLTVVFVREQIIVFREHGVDIDVSLVLHGDGADEVHVRCLQVLRPLGDSLNFEIIRRLLLKLCRIPI